MSEDFDSDHESITNALLDLENSFMNELKKIRSVINGDCDISILGTNSEVSDINPELKTVKKIDSVFDESFSKLFHLREGLKKKITNKLKRKGFVVPSVSSSSTSDDDSLSTTEDSSSTLLSKASTNQRSSSSLASCRDFKIKIKPIEFDQNKLNTTNLSDLSASLSETPCTKRVRFQETDTDKLDNSAEAMESNSSIRRSSRIRILPKKLRRPSFEFDSDEEDIVEGSVNAQNNESVKTTVSSSSSTGISSSNEESESSNHVDDSQSKNQGDLNKGASEYSSNPGPSAPKRKRGRPKIIDDDDDDDDSDDDYKKRRQRKHTSSDGNDSNSDEDSPSKAKRKNIRKVKSTKDLGDEAKNAAREEIERRKRIEERQKLYNQVIDEDIEKVKQLDKLVLDFDEKTKEELIVVNSTLVKNLKPHQANGIKFMWDACFESLQQINNGHPGSGCILAHCMGLGKTLQVITLTHTLFANTAKTKVNKVLVITPLSTVLNWANEFKTWLKDCKPNLHIFEMSKKTKNQDRVKVLKEWHDRGGVMLLGYDLFRILCNLTNGRMPKRQKEQLRESLIDPGPDLIVCDEGHLLKNEKTSLSKAVNQIRTRRRVVLTGTPLQNNLKEYYCMVQFVKPNLLGKYTEYLNRFVNPITNGQYTDSTPRDIQLMKKRSHVLHKLLDACVQRRDYGVLAPFLPKKHEYILYIKLTDLQATLYKYYMENKPNQLDPLLAKRSSVLFADFQNLQRIWTHPRVLRYNSDRYELVLQKRRLEDDEEESEGSINNFIDDSDSDETSSMASDRSVEPIKKRTRSTIRDSDSEMEIITTKDDNPTEWWMSMVDETELDNINHSGKLLLLMAILDKCEAIGDKLLVFSQSLYSLDVIEHFLNLIDNSTQENKADDKLAKHMGSWSPGVDYFRLDGSTSIQNRDQMCKLFNDKSNTRARLFLISTRAGGLGINLVAANRVIIFDASWNPSHDVQSIFRIYRFGQKKPCFVYRFVAMGTMEEKIYDRQVTKQAISKRVIDEQQIDRHYKENDLMELYSFNFDDPERPVPIFPKDRLFAEVLDEYPKILFKYHEHDSLLENKEEETLNEEERKAAWDEFEQEKSAPMVIASPYPTMMVRHPTHHNGPVTSNMSYGIRNDILLKLLNIKVRQDFPHLNDSQVGGLIPSYVQRLQAQMDVGNYELYCSILNLKMALENPALLGMPAGSGYSNAIREYMSQPMNVPMMPLPMAQNKMMNEQDRSRIGNPINTNLSSTEVIELD